MGPECESSSNVDYPETLMPLLNRFRPPWAPAILAGEGWWSLLADLDVQLAGIDPDYQVSEVREEFAELVVVPHAASNGVDPAELTAAVAEAMARAGRTCEVCGRRGRFLRQGRFFIMLCWDHADERGAVWALDADDPDIIVPRLTDQGFAAAVVSGRPARAYTREGHADAVAWAAREHAAFESELASWLTTGDMAATLGVTAATVRRRVQLGRLCAARRDNRRWAFPRWQVSTDGGMVDGLAEVLPLFAPRYDAVAITTAMTTPRTRFRNRTALAWLEGGGDAGEVAHYVRDLG